MSTRHSNAHNLSLRIISDGGKGERPAGSYSFSVSSRLPSPLIESSASNLSSVMSTRTVSLRTSVKAAIFDAIAVLLLAFTRWLFSTPPSRTGGKQSLGRSLVEISQLMHVLKWAIIRKCCSVAHNRLTDVACSLRNCRDGRSIWFDVLDTFRSIGSNLFVLFALCSRLSLMYAL